jgi:reversibly glycosylated polypeptide/UDP-arabinopyranose mutase
MNKGKVAIVVPTIEGSEFTKSEYHAFIHHWAEDLQGYHLVTVWDGDDQRVEHLSPNGDVLRMLPDEIMENDLDLIIKKSAACRNLGFAYVVKYLPEVEYIITLDHDTRPLNTIEDHLRVLGTAAPVSWLNSADDLYMRGMPYGVRKEAEVVVSHGIWMGVPDLDAPNQLVLGDRHDPQYHIGAVPKGILMPVCGMNLAFHVKALPYIYYAPVSTESIPGAERFDDIWMGICMLREIEKLGWACFTGAAAVVHDRASNVFKNLKREALGIELNEKFWEVYGTEEEEKLHPFFKEYKSKRERWKALIKTWIK